MTNLLDAARWTGSDPEPHQMAAWNWLNGQISNEERDGFLEMFRAAPAAKAPLVPAAPPASPLEPLLALIRSHEGGWESVNRGRAGDTPSGWQGLSQMTVREIMAAQAAGKVFAVGAYQIVPVTMGELVKKSNISPNALFTPEQQNRMATALIIGGWKRPSLAKYLLGKWQDTEANLSKAQNDLAYEWASLPNSEGRGWYDGDKAGNRARGDVEEVRKTLRSVREALTAKVERPAAPAAPAAPIEEPAPRYFTQRDNGEQSDRSCFSSTCAMLAELVKPGCLGPGLNADLTYLAMVMRHGDTVQADAQIAAMAELGITARLVRNGGQSLIDEQVKRWGGLALGYIHRGSLDALDNRSAGHWAMCWGVSPDTLSLRLHDPMGCPNVVQGGFVSGRSGEAVQVARPAFSRRWELAGPPYQYERGRGWAIVVDGVA